MPSLYPDPVTGPYAIPTMAEVADAPQAFEDFADSIPIGGNARVIEAANNPFTLTNEHSGAIVSCKTDNINIKFDPSLTNGFNCAIVSTAGRIFIDPAETFQGDAQVAQYTMGSIIKISGDVLVSTPRDLSQVSSILTVSKYTAVTYTLDNQNDKNGTLVLNTQDGATWTITGGYTIGDVINICNASDSPMTIVCDPADSVKFYYNTQTFESNGTPDRFDLSANSTAMFLRIPKEGSSSTDFALSAVASAVTVV